MPAKLACPPFNLRTAGNLPNLELSLVQLASHRQAHKRACTNRACERVLVRNSTWVAVGSRAGPILGGIIVLAQLLITKVAGAFGLLVAYGVGAALPMLMIAYGGRAFSRRILKLRSHSAMLQRVGGVMIVVTAIFILLGWDVQVQLWLAPLFPTLPL